MLNLSDTFDWLCDSVETLYDDYILLSFSRWLIIFFLIVYYSGSLKIPQKFVYEKYCSYEQILRTRHFTYRKFIKDLLTKKRKENM